RTFHVTPVCAAAFRTAIAHPQDSTPRRAQKIVETDVHRLRLRDPRESRSRKRLSLDYQCITNPPSTLIV
ncbi:MAG: hypothetical protein L0271_09270, partial [Gemmatimonadetes bacterium]|nr:hypothetical protein [Gemmatimonadota bacterium]